MSVLCSDLAVLNEFYHRSFFSLGRNVDEFIQNIFFFEQSLFKLRCGTVIGIVLCQSVIVIKHVDFFPIWAKLTMAFTFTSFPLNLYKIFLFSVVVSDLNKSFGGSTDLAKKRHGSLHTPIHPLGTANNRRGRSSQLFLLTSARD